MVGIDEQVDEGLGVIEVRAADVGGDDDAGIIVMTKSRRTRALRNLMGVKTRADP